MKHSIHFYISKFLNNLIINHYVADRDINKLRAKLLSLAKYAPKTSRHSKITPVKTDQFNGNWIEPKEGLTDRTFLYLHGGGYIFATPGTYHAFLSHICNKSKIRAFYLDYPLAPEHPFPAALESAYQSYKWLLSQGIDPKKIIIGGDSAGGGLTLALLLYLKQKGDPQPGRAVVLSPYVDLTPEAVFPEEVIKKDPILRKLIQLDICPQAYAPNQDRHNPLISPLFGDFTRTCPILMLAATEDSLIEQDLKLAESMKMQGVDLQLIIGEGMFHVWPVFLPPAARESQEAMGQIIKFINT